MAKHCCHAFACHFEVKPEHLMCRRHWKMVPLDIQLEVYRAYRLGQSIDKNASREYIAAAKSAREAVEVKEREQYHDRILKRGV